jgi:hypothetical protein
MYNRGSCLEKSLPTHLIELKDVEKTIQEQQPLALFQCKSRKKGEHALLYWQAILTFTFSPWMGSNEVWLTIALNWISRFIVLFFLFWNLVYSSTYYTQ